MIRKLMFENYDLTYNLMKEDRKTVSLSVLPNEKIILKIPSIASNEKADKFIVNKLNWILKQQDFFKKFNKKKISKKYVSGEDFIYLGRRYLLIIKIGDKPNIKFNKNKLVCTVKYKKDVKKHINNFLIKKAEHIFLEQLLKCVKCFKDIKNMPTLKIRKLNRRWGSYLKKHIVVLNIDLIKAKKRCIDYVIMHELCHYYYDRHNKDFYALLEQVMPNYKELKQELELCNLK